MTFINCWRDGLAFAGRLRSTWGRTLRGGAETVATVDGKGNMVAAPGFNLFALSGSSLHDPAYGVLEGITRRTVIELADAPGYSDCIARRAGHVPPGPPDRLRCV